MTFTGYITSTFSEGFYSGLGVVESDVESPLGAWDCSLDGMPFMFAEPPSYRSIPTLRQQQDSGNPGELSLNPEGLWRRSQSSWHEGAGQTHLDTEDGVTTRFRASKGVNPWTRGELTLLHDTELVHAAVSTLLTPKMATANGLLYWLDGQTTQSSDGTTRTQVASTPAATAVGLASTGSALYLAYGASGIYRVVVGSPTTAASWLAGQADGIWWAKGRLLRGAANVLADVSTGTAVTLLTHPDSGWTWDAAAEGLAHAYAAGHSGDRSVIYRLGLKDDGTGLDVPIVAGQLPAGELVTEMYGYLGILVIGTTAGFRIAQQSASGDLSIGRVVAVGAVRAFVGFGDFVWFGWSNFDATSTGTGRMDLSTFTDTRGLVPAYASDLMVAEQGAVYGLAYFADKVWIAVAGEGVYAESTDLVPTGTLDSGLISWGITETKIVRGGAANYTGNGTAVVTVASNGGAPQFVAASGDDIRGASMEVRVTLEGDTASGPVVKSYTLLGQMAPAASWKIIAPLRLSSLMVAHDRSEHLVDLATIRARLLSLWDTKEAIRFHDGANSWLVTLEDFEWRPESIMPDHSGQWSGTYVATLKIGGA